MWTIIHIIDIMLWVIMACSVIYVTFFAFISLFTRSSFLRPSHSPHFSFLILYPAYKEDRVILNSVKQFLEQTYPKELYHVAVISDHMQDATNRQLRELPITLHTLTFEKSSKAKAMQYAMRHTEGVYDFVVILDADNVVKPDFLQLLSTSCEKGYQAIQCHRCAKNSNNNIAVLDGTSEEINNTIFRKAHNTIGLSSALIGSGMCFDFNWFKEHVEHLSSAVEDRELESCLIQDKIYVKFEEDILVFDEKVSHEDNFERQRLRWLNGQLQSLLIMLPHIPHAIATADINYIDKTIQQALIPRSILLALIPVFALVMLILAPVWSVKWWALFLVLCLTLYIAIPSKMRTSMLWGKLIGFPRLAFKMLKNLFYLDKNNKNFLHTTHGE
ncbi:MAG: glycosyltransferase [Paludibacteraceae bacterium]|nr:glycosyltransferase [Paludibacteraceae bacterium]MBQ8715671.1 glycosyltransferase [Prevotella sp.]